MRTLIGLLICFFISTSAPAATYSENFNDGAANGWTKPAGTWAVVSSTYRSTAIGGADISVYGAVKWATDFTLSARIYNAYNAQANQAGVVYNYVNANNYYAVKFAPTGQAYLIKVIAGAQTTVATQTYAGGGSEVWFDVDVIRSGSMTTVKVNGVTVFNNVNQSQLGAGRIGLVTTFAEAYFNNVTVDSAAPFSENFNDGVPNSWTVSSGTWNVVNGTYRSTAIGASNIALYGGASWTTGFTYKARVYNAYSAEGNLAGVVYNYVNASNYYVARFGPTGQASLAKVIAGTETTVATASYSGGGSEIWFDVDVVRTATTTTVMVNGAPVFNNIAQSELGAGKVGLVTSFAEARFDNIVLALTPAGGDTQAPSVPLGLTATPASPTRIDVAWNPSTDNVGVAGYRIYVNNALLASTAATSYSHSGLSPEITYNYRVSAYDAALNHSAQSAPVAATTPAGPSEVTYSCNFDTGPAAWEDCGFFEQKLNDGSPRATIINVARPEFPSFPSKAVQLHTKNIDHPVAGSGNAVRNDLVLADGRTECFQGQEQWWAHSVMFPSGYNPSSSNGWYVVLDFHHDADNGGQANFNLDSAWWGGHTLRIRGYGGQQRDPDDNSPADFGEVALTPVVENTWYDFVYHVKWSSGSDGFFRAWLRKGSETSGQLVLNHSGPTLYIGQGCYLKLANYHEPSVGDSFVVHARVVRGTSAGAVSLTPLQ